MTGIVRNETPGVCIVCGRRIPKRTSTVWVRPSTTRFSGGPSPVIDADLRTRADCKAYTNQLVISHQRNLDGHVVSFETWDGSSYVNEYFCRQKCERAQGRAAAQHGARFTWKRA